MITEVIYGILTRFTLLIALFNLVYRNSTTKEMANYNVITRFAVDEFYSAIVIGSGSSTGRELVKQLLGTPLCLRVFSVDLNDLVLSLDIDADMSRKLVHFTVHDLGEVALKELTPFVTAGSIDNLF